MIGLRFWAVFSSEFSSSFHRLAFFPLSSLCGYIGNRILWDAYAPSSCSPLYFYSQVPSPALLLSPGSWEQDVGSSLRLSCVMYCMHFFSSSFSLIILAAFTTRLLPLCLFLSSLECAQAQAVSCRTWSQFPSIHGSLFCLISQHWNLRSEHDIVYTSSRLVWSGPLCCICTIVVLDGGWFDGWWRR